MILLVALNDYLELIHYHASNLLKYTMLIFLIYYMVNFIYYILYLMRNPMDYKDAIKTIFFKGLPIISHIIYGIYIIINNIVDYIIKYISKLIVYLKTVYKNNFILKNARDK